MGDTGVGQIGVGVTLASLVLLAGLELRAGATRRAIAHQAPTLARAAASPNPAPASRLWRPRHHESALVEIVRDIPYGDHPALRLDLHLPRAREQAPVVIQIHGGSWIRGKRHNQGRPLLRRLAEQGFIGVTIDYRLCPDGRLPDQVADVKRAIAWVRTEIAARGGDPEWIAVTGGSAGGHLATMAALTGNDPRYQPGFEQVDTRIRACVPYWGSSISATGSGYGDEPPCVRFSRRSSCPPA